MTALSAPSPIAAAGASPPGGERSSPLSGAQLGEFELANKRCRKIRRAAGVAKVDAWLTGIFAGCTLLSAIFSPWALILAVALVAVSFNSYRGASRLGRFDPAAPGLLARNQLILAAILTCYAASCLWTAGHATPELISAANGAGPDVAKALGGFHLGRLFWLLNVAIYGSLILGTWIAQGSAALYYRSRRKNLLAYLAATPAWILELQKAQVPR